MSESRKLITVRNETVNIGKYICNFLIDNNNKIYVRESDLKRFEIDEKDFRHWITKHGKDHPKYTFESYYINEHDKAVKVWDAKEVCTYIGSAGKTYYFPILAYALYDIIDAEERMKEKENDSNINEG
jgi:hypothetical protein